MTVKLQGYFQRILQLDSIHECPGTYDPPQCTVRKTIIEMDIQNLPSLHWITQLDFVFHFNPQSTGV